MEAPGSRALDAEGKVIAEAASTQIGPLFFEPDSFGVITAHFDPAITDVAEFEFDLPTVPIDEDEGRFSDLMVTSLDTSGSVTVYADVHNDTDIKFDFTPTFGIHLDEEMNIGGGASNHGLAVGPDSDITTQRIAKGEVTDRFLYTAPGFANG